jgi:hypothetical protein
MFRKVSAKNLVFPLFLTLISALLFSCAEKKPSESSTVYVDNLSLPAEPREISDYIEDMYVIPLETHPEALLGNFWITDQDESGIFLVSGQNETVYHFSREGKYLNSFCHKGKGPGEYLSIINIRIVPGTETLLISDARLNKMFQYTFAGELVKEFRIPQGTGRFVLLKNGNIALHIGRLVDPQEHNFDLNEMLILDMDGKIVQKYFPFENRLYFEFSNPFTRPDADGTSYYSKCFDYNLYRLLPDGKPEVCLKIDYGKPMATIDDLAGPGLENLAELRKQGKRWTIDDMVNTTDHLMLINRKDRKTSLLVVNKKTLEITAFGTDSVSSPGKYHGFPVRFIRDAYKNHFYYVMEALEIHDLMASLSPEQKRTLTKKIKGFKQLMNIGIDDNPVMVFFRFRE